MKFAFETVPYGRRIVDTPSVMREIAAHGYHGVEFAQHPKLLGGINDVDHLYSLAAEFGLTILGFVGGTLSERMEFCREKRPEYLIVDSWTDDCENAIGRGYKLALHPHLFGPVARMSEAEAPLKTHPDLWICPDTGHLTIAGDNPARVVEKYGPRVVAVHLKDWEPKYGRYSHRYARGFVELGQGIVALEEVIAAVKAVENPYRDPVWIVAEVDSSRISPEDSMRECAEWLRNNGLLKPPPGRESPRSEPTVSDSVLNPAMELAFARRLHGAALTGPERFYHEVVLAFRQAMPCAMAEFRVFTPSLDTLELVAWDRGAGINWEPETSLNCKSNAQNLSSRAIHAETLQRFDLTEPAIIAARSDPQKVVQASLKYMISLPVECSWSSKNMRFLLNLFFAEVPPEISKDGISANDAQLYRMAEMISKAADQMLDEQCMAAAGKILPSTWNGKTLNQYLEFLRNQIQFMLNCDGVAIFTVNPQRDRLELAATTSTQWNQRIPAHQQYYQKDADNDTTQAWRERRLQLLNYLAIDREKDRPRSWESVSDSERHQCLIFPISRTPVSKGSGRTVGVVRCTNKKKGHTPLLSTMFTDEDAAVLDAMLMAALPQIDLLMHQKTHFGALARLTHEFQTPIVAIRGAVQLMQRGFAAQQITPRDFFVKADYLEDIWQWSELMGRLVTNADLFRGTYQGLPLHPKPTRLMSDVVAPAVMQVSILLRQFDLPINRITFGDFSSIPPLMIDPNQFQQVIFNLLSNAIKFASPKERFHVNIDGGRVSRQFVIWCFDTGPGIRADVEELIFEEGFRDPQSANKVAGDGLGLAVIKAVIEKHGGTIRLANRVNPTTFEISLPERLACKPTPRG